MSITAVYSLEVNHTYNSHLKMEASTQVMIACAASMRVLDLVEAQASSKQPSIHNIVSTYKKTREGGTVPWEELFKWEFLRSIGKHNNMDYIKYCYNEGLNDSHIESALRHIIKIRTTIISSDGSTTKY